MIGAGETSSADRTSLPEGWALKSTKRSARFNEAQKTYLQEKFTIGQESGYKQDPETVARDMRSAKKQDGSRLFSTDEFLTTQQIQSYFSRMASKLRHADISDSDAKAVQEEQHYEEMRQRVLDEVQLKHPITYDNLNLCDMNKRGTLRQFSIAMLQTLCGYFDLITEGFNSRRKAQYVSVLRDLVQTCNCCSAE